MSQPEPAATFSPQAAPARIVLGGFLMGMANLVPGVSGGTMILAIGLYERFIESVARVTSLRWSRATIVFMGLLVGGALVAILSLSAPAVWLVLEHRWIAYSLFIGMTLGGVPLLWRSLGAVRELGVGSWLSFAVSLAGMLWVARGLSNAPIEQGFLTFTLVGALAASSMILPGISGSYILLIFGLYDVVVGSLRPSELLDDPLASLAILVPTGLGVLLGIGALSNVLKLVLERYARPAHCALLGLLLGSVAGLWPFQEAVHPELVAKKNLRAIAMLVAGDAPEAILEKTEREFEAAERDHYLDIYAGMSKGDLKLMGLELEPYEPTGARIAMALGLLVGGFVLTGALGKRA